ncbi:MAG: hypothetical protein LC748_15680, partial [Thermomicrobia bacterium]|nr:hypothetical protein [Thermomicrobia bacterium]
MRQIAAHLGYLHAEAAHLHRVAVRVEFEPVPFEILDEIGLSGVRILLAKRLRNREAEDGQATVRVSVRKEDIGERVPRLREVTGVCWREWRFIAPGRSDFAGKQAEFDFVWCALELGVVLVAGAFEVLNGA